MLLDVNETASTLSDGIAAFVAIYVAALNIGVAAQRSGFVPLVGADCSSPPGPGSAACFQGKPKHHRRMRMPGGAASSAAARSEIAVSITTTTATRNPRIRLAAIPKQRTSGLPKTCGLLLVASSIATAAEVVAKLAPAQTP
jgi:hypothetical protein